ncbi:hypothetical protein JD844_032789 [Phrynosoma platyrhinos]|uniref:Uncharacterized protein n=1 Tax=Phrynosoma platyrhinos TaxID=52577 RepID=A0ABQ7T562_PHRPL|nr:hypothetical protein JD844_032789 [Phrynosoma platyrhinos]
MGKSSEQKYDYCACAKLRRNQLLHYRHFPQHVEIISVVAARRETSLQTHIPPAISEEGNIILHLVPVEQPLVLDPHPAEDMEPQDLPSSPAASDETLISGEGPQEEATQSPGGKTQAPGPNVGSDSPQEAAVSRGNLLKKEGPPFKNFLWNE